MTAFDVSVNAVGVELGSGKWLDPLGGLDDIASATLTLNQHRWHSANELELECLVQRLDDLCRTARLVVNNPEVLSAALRRRARAS